MKLPRDLSGKQISVALIRLGFVVERQKGSHVRLSKDNLRVTIVMCDDTRIGTLKSILRQANITIEKLKENL